MNEFAPTASSFASQWDWLFFVLVTVSSIVVMTLLVAIVAFSIRYRRGAGAFREALPGSIRNRLEFGWTTATTLAFLAIFWWAGAAQLSHAVPPEGAMQIHVLAKQWMWKIEQPNGAREINELHAPIGRPVELIMTSEDVIHSMFLPALRLKQDVLPGRYTYLWFNADKAGVYHLLCAEFCGTGHSRMTGRVVLMDPVDYSRWSAAQPQAEDPAKQGEALFSSLGCTGCHADNASVHAPHLKGVYGRPVQLADGRSVVADEAYIRDSILLPKKDIVAGYLPIMPSFSGQVNEEQIMQLVAYVKSLATGEKSE